MNKLLTAATDQAYARLRSDVNEIVGEFNQIPTIQVSNADIDCLISELRYVINVYDRDIAELKKANEEDHCV